MESTQIMHIKMHAEQLMTGGNHVVSHKPNIWQVVRGITKVFLSSFITITEYLFVIIAWKEFACGCVRACVRAWKKSRVSYVVGSGLGSGSGSGSGSQWCGVSRGSVYRERDCRLGSVWRRRGVGASGVGAHVSPEISDSPGWRWHYANRFGISAHAKWFEREIIILVMIDDSCCFVIMTLSYPYLFLALNDTLPILFRREGRRTHVPMMK